MVDVKIAENKKNPSFSLRKNDTAYSGINIPGFVGNLATLLTDRSS